MYTYMDVLSEINLIIIIITLVSKLSTRSWNENEPKIYEKQYIFIG